MKVNTRVMTAERTNKLSTYLIDKKEATVNNKDKETKILAVSIRIW